MAGHSTRGTGHKRESRCEVVRQGDHHAQGMPRIHQASPTSSRLIRPTERLVVLRMERFYRR